MKPSSDNLIEFFNNKVNFSTSISTCYNTDFILYPPNCRFRDWYLSQISDCEPKKLVLPRFANGTFSFINLKL